jgi:heparan-sulfate lyase
MRTKSLLHSFIQPARIFLLTALMSCFLFINGSSKGIDMAQETQKLISRLNPETPGLEKAFASSDDSPDFSGELLKYFRARTSVKHHVNRGERLSALGNSASEGDFVAADNALKHIFVGQPAYPPYFCGDDIDWGSRPVPDNEWVWQLNRMGFWGSLARVYWHTGDEKYARAWVNQMMDWYRKNPNDEAHRYAWRSIEAGIRGHSWTGLYQRFVDSPSFTPEAMVVFLNSLYDHASFLMTKYSTRSNWGLMEAEGMAFIAFTFPEFRDALVWRTEAIRRLNNEMNIQVYPDGHQRELAMGYHTGCIGWFSRTWELAKMNGIDDAFPQSYIDRIEKMCEVPMKLCHPDGTIAQFGDSWAGRPGQYNQRYREWAELYNRQDFLFMATGGKEGKEPDSTAYALKQSGLYSMRSGWSQDAICLVMKCGPDGGGHSQPDNGTFELSAGGRTLMPDAGSYIYSGDPANRAWFRQTKVHQTLTLDGKTRRMPRGFCFGNPARTLTW